MTDTKTAAERAQEIADRTSGWSRKDVAELAITDTVTRVREEMSKIENVPDSVLLAKENIDIAHLKGGIADGCVCGLCEAARQESKALVAAAYLDALWAVDEAHRRNISGENWHERVRNFVASRSSADAQAALDRHVAAAVQKAREEWDREEQHGCCENLKKKIVEIANLKAQYDKALAGWQAERSDWQNDVKKLEGQLAEANRKRSGRTGKGQRS